METIQALKDSGAPQELWYVSTLVLTCILILFISILTFFVKNFFNELKDTLKGMAESIRNLTKMVELHDSEIKHMRDDVDKLEKRRR